MSEIAHWEREWVEKVIEKTKQYPQHIFQFLTKFPEVYEEWVFPKNCWLGVTITNERDYCHTGDGWYYFCKKNNITYLSLEPLLENFDTMYLDYTNINWVIIGAETGNRIGKIIPKKEWVLDIVKYCDLNKIPIYIKDNLTKYFPEFNNKKEFPK